EFVSPERRTQHFNIPNRRDVTNELAVADRGVVLRIVQIKKAARALVDHARIPVEHKSESIADHPGRLLVMNLSVRVSLAGHGCASPFRVALPQRAGTRSRGTDGTATVAGPATRRLLLSEVPPEEQAWAFLGLGVVSDGPQPALTLVMKCLELRHEIGAPARKNSRLESGERALPQGGLDNDATLAISRTRVSDQLLFRRAMHRPPFTCYQ